MVLGHLKTNFQIMVSTVNHGESNHGAIIHELNHIEESKNNYRKHAKKARLEVINKLNVLYSKYKINDEDQVFKEISEALGLWKKALFELPSLQIQADYEMKNFLKEKDFVHFVYSYAWSFNIFKADGFGIFNKIFERNKTHLSKEHYQFLTESVQIICTDYYEFLVKQSKIVRKENFRSITPVCHEFLENL